MKRFFTELFASARAVLVLPAVSVLFFGVGLPAATGAGAAAGAGAAEQKPGKKEADRVFSDPEYGCTFKIPRGFRRLTKKEHRLALQGIVEEFGKSTGVRFVRRPPVWFRGPAPADAPQQAAILSLRRTRFAKPVAFSARDLPACRKTVEEAYRRKNLRTGEIKVSLVRINDAPALCVEHYLVDRRAKTRDLMTRYFIPGAEGLLYEVTFQYRPEMKERMEEALRTFRTSFHAAAATVATPEERAKWSRVLKITIACFVAGVLLHFLLRALSGVGEKPAEENP